MDEKKELKYQRLNLIVGSLLIAIGFFAIGWYFGRLGFRIDLAKNPAEIKIVNEQPGDQTVDFHLFWEVWNLVNQGYLERPLDAQKLLYGAISGMVDAIGDPYTAFLTPEQNQLLEEGLNGQYEGIGIELSIREEQLMIVSPLEGSPAQNAGVKPGDKIIKVEDETTVGMSLLDAVAKIRGRAGTICTLTLQRKDEPPFEVKIRRARITVESVSWEDKGDGIAYIRVSRFADSTNTEWRRVVDEILEKMPDLKAVILDMRGNPGGYLQGSVTISSEFFQEGAVVIQESSNGSQQVMQASGSGRLLDVPVVVLINEGSASASEIVALALKEQRKAVLVGQPSFGKGTIQDAHPLENGAGIHITVAKWLSPNGVWLDEKGIDPDVKIEITDEDTTEGKDPQLEKALEIAKGM